MAPSTRPLLLALALSTDSARAALYDVNGDVEATARVDLPLPRERAGLRERDPLVWLEAIRELVAACLIDDTARARLAGVGITGTMLGLVALPGSTPPDLHNPHALGPALWCEGGRPAVTERADVGIPEPAALARAWACLVGEGDDRARIARRIVAGPAGFVAWALGMGSWCDQTTAACSGLARPDGMAWLPSRADQLNLPQRLLPGILGETLPVLGRVGPESAALCGLPEGVPLVVAPAEQATTAIGLTGCVSGQPFCVYGPNPWLGLTRTASALSRYPASRVLPVPGGVTDDCLGSPSTVYVEQVTSEGAAATLAWARRLFLDSTDVGGTLAAWALAHGRGPTGIRARLAADDGLSALEQIPLDTDRVTLFRAFAEAAVATLSRHAARIGVSLTGPLPLVGDDDLSAAECRLFADVFGVPIAYLPGGDATLTGCALVAARALGLAHRLRPLAAAPGVEVTDPDPEAAAAFRNWMKDTYGSSAVDGAPWRTA